MNIVDLAPGDLTLDQAARIAGCGARTLRRAVRDGHLPRRYAPCPRGLKLVFGRADLARWIADRQARRDAKHSPSPAHRPGAEPAWPHLPAQVAQLETLLQESRGMIAELTTKLHDQDRALSTIRATVSQLVGGLARLEAEGTGARAGAPEREPALHAPRP